MIAHLGHDKPPTTGPRDARPGVTTLTLLVLCACVFAQAFVSLRQKSLTYDEISYIPAGYSYVKTGDYRLNPEQPPLMKLLAGVALLPLDPVLPTDDSSWTDAGAGVGNTQWLFGEEFLIHANDNGEALILAARLPVVFVLILLVAVAYLFARDLYGRSAGLVAAALCAFSPNLLAHGRLATTDLGLTCFVLLTVYTFHRFTRAPTVGNLLLAGVALGLALLTKFSAVLLLPLLGLWAAALPILAPEWVRRGSGAATATSTERSGLPSGLFRRRPPWDTLTQRRPWGPYAWATMSLTAMGVVALVIIALGYRSPAGPVIYLRDLGMVGVNTAGAYRAYFHGTFRQGGVWYYFIAAFLLKTPLAFLLLLALRTALTVRTPSEDRFARLLLLSPIVLWLLVISWRAFQVGIRYVLPAYPLLFVFAAGIVATPAFARRPIRLLTVGLVGWFASTSLMAHPHYLSYFNELGGSAEGGIAWLDDSNIDWGQDVILLRDFLRTTEPGDVRVTPMAPYDPVLYGVDAELVPPSTSLALLSNPDPPSGTWAVSVHLLNRIRMNPDALVDPLRDLDPVAVLGHTIYVYVFP